MDHDPVDEQLHRVMTRLSVIKGYAQLLTREVAKEHAEPHRVQSYAARVQFEADRLATLLLRLQESLQPRENGTRE